MTRVPEPRVAKPLGGCNAKLLDSVGTSCSTGRYLLLHEVLTIPVVRFEMVLASQSDLVKASLLLLPRAHGVFYVEIRFSL